MAFLGAEPEIDNINEMVYKPEQAEKSCNERTQEQSHQTEGDKQTPKWEWTWFKNRTSGNKHFQPIEKEEKASSSKPDKVRANAMSPQHDEKLPKIPRPSEPNAQKPKPTPQVKKWPKEKLDIL